MRNIIKLAAVALIGAATVAVPAAAVVTTFASFSPTGNVRNIRWVGSGANATFYSTATGTANVPGTVNVRFSFLQPAINPYVDSVTAKFTLNGTVANQVATVSGGTIEQTKVGGTFSFISTTAITIGSTTFAAGSNLLSGSFSNTTISGNRNGSSANLSGSTPASSFSFTSDFLTFVPGANYDLAWSLTSINPLLNATNAANQITGTPNKALRTFRATLGGQFSSDPAPIPPLVPEPQSWMLLIAGFGLVGAASRRRRTSVAA